MKLQGARSTIFASAVGDRQCGNSLAGQADFEGNRCFRNRLDHYANVALTVLSIDIGDTFPEAFTSKSTGAEKFRVTSSADGS